jgi:hypothetical protein
LNDWQVMSLNYWKRVADLQQQGIFNLELFNFLLLIFLILFEDFLFNFEYLHSTQSSLS